MASTRSKLPTDVRIEGNRVKDVTIIKPIVYGNVAKAFGRKRETDGHTHQWTVFVKPYRNENIGQYIRKVQFKLHESYANSTRTVNQPPFEVSETGWGEFEVHIKLYFVDPNEKPLMTYHILKLFIHGDPLTATGQKEVVSEIYDEIIFHEPTVEMYKTLSGSAKALPGLFSHPTNFDVKKENTLTAIAKARAAVRQEIAEVNEELKNTRQAIQKYRQELQNIGAVDAAAEIFSDN